MPDLSQTFRDNLLLAVKASGLSEAEASRKAGLNRRAITDLREGRTKSPTLKTASALADALDVDIGVLLGLGPRSKINSALSGFLAGYSEDDQERFLAALQALFPQERTGTR